jgi:hypothetical protein
MDNELKGPCACEHCDADFRALILVLLFSSSFSVDSRSTEEHALKLDKDDALSSFRSKFCIPSIAALQAVSSDSKDYEAAFKKAKESSKEDEAIYLCGNSLGLQPKATAQILQVCCYFILWILFSFNPGCFPPQDELTKWSLIGVEGHFFGKRPWFVFLLISSLVTLEVSHAFASFKGSD